MRMLESLIIGAAVGVAGMVVKDKITGASSNGILEKKQRELDNIYSENEKLSKRNKEMERKIEDLISENQKLHKKFTELDDNHDDIEDELSDLKKKLSRITQEKEALSRELQEYKLACENYKIENDRLKGK